MNNDYAQTFQNLFQVILFNFFVVYIWPYIFSFTKLAEKHGKSAGRLAVGAKKRKIRKVVKPLEL